MRATTGSSPATSSLTVAGVDVGAVVAAAGTEGGLGGSVTAGADGVVAGAEVVAANDDGVTNEEAAAAAADKRAAVAETGTEEAAAAGEGAEAQLSGERRAQAST